MRHSSVVARLAAVTPLLPPKSTKVSYTTLKLAQKR